MSKESLDELKVAFKRWRLKKRYVTERVPAELLGRAQRAVVEHGISRVALATKIGRHHFAEQNSGRLARGKKKVVPLPTFSRIQIPAVGARSTPVAEAETVSGMKLRVFAITPETIGLLSSFCRTGGAA
jgi:hypothetical protein